MADDASAGWRPLIEVDFLEVGAPQRVVVDGLPPLAVLKLDDGDCHVIDDTCSHGQASLADGFVEGDEVECPWHAGRFCVRDGRATAPPATEAIRAYATRVVDGQVCIKVNVA